MQMKQSSTHKHAHTTASAESAQIVKSRYTSPTSIPVWTKGWDNYPPVFRQLKVTNTTHQHNNSIQLQRQQSSQQQATSPNNPPSGSPYSSLAPDLLATLRRSFDERIQGLPNSEKNLDNSFWGGKPANLWDALDRLFAADINSLVEVYERAGGAWAYVYSIQNIWTGSSKGFMFTCKDSVGLANYLAGSNSFCKDSSIGQSEHQKPNAKDCWRETIKGSFGLHFCLDRGHNLTGNELHIDLHQTVNKKDMDGSCNYSIISGTWIRHIWDVKMDYDKSIFERFQDSQNDVQRLHSEFRVSSDNDLVTAETRLKALAPFMRQQAVRGLQGEQQAKAEKSKELEEIEGLIRKVFVRVVPRPPMTGPKF